MALFPGDLTEVLTPDGRRITMPQSLAASFPALQPVAPVAPPPGAVPPQELPSIPQLAPQEQPQIQPEPIATAPVTMPGQAPAGAPLPAPEPQRGPVTSPEPGPDAGRPNGPQPVTEQQLATMGISGAGNAELAAQEERRTAARAHGEALASQATAIGDKMVAAEDQAAQMLAERKQAAEQHAAALQAETESYFRNAKAIADTKVDRSVDHPVMAAISSALLGIGQAMAGQPIDVMTPLYKAIDRKVQGQMQDLEQRRAGLATQREGLGMMRQSGMDKLTEMDTHRLAYIESARRQVEAFKQKTSSDVIRSNADMLDAELRSEQAKTISGMQDRWQTRQEQKEARAMQERQHRQSLAVQMRGQDMQQRESDLNREERRQEKLDERAAQLLALGQKDRAEKVKAVGAQSVGDPTSGEDILQPEGQAKVKEAAKLEASAEKFAAAAAAEKDPGKRKALETRAAAEKQRAFDLRTEVASDPKMTWTIDDEKSRREVGERIATGQTIASTADQIKLLREQHGPKWLTTSEGQAFMQSKGTAVLMALKDAWGLGVLSRLDVDLLDKATGGDPAKLTLGDVSNFLGAEGVASRLDGLVSTLEEGTRDRMRVLKFRGDFKFRRQQDERTPEEKAAGDALKGETPLESAGKHRDRQGAFGAIERAVERGGIEDLPSRRIEGSGSAKYPGLSKAQEPAVDLQLKAYKAGLSSEDDQAQKKSARSGKLLVQLATDSKRPALRDAMLTTLQANAPELYEQALAALPDDVRAVRTRQPGMPKRGLETLSEEEREQFTDQKDARAEAARRDAYRSAYVKQAAKGTLGAQRDRTAKENPRR
jgi:hypothetical protein